MRGEKGGRVGVLTIALCRKGQVQMLHAVAWRNGRPDTPPLHAPKQGQRAGQGRLWGERATCLRDERAGCDERAARGGAGSCGTTTSYL